MKSREVSARKPRGFRFRRVSETTHSSTSRLPCLHACVRLPFLPSPRPWGVGSGIRPASRSLSCAPCQTRPRGSKDGLLTLTPPDTRPRSAGSHGGNSRIRAATGRHPHRQSASFAHPRVATNQAFDVTAEVGKKIPAVFRKRSQPALAEKPGQIFTKDSVRAGHSCRRWRNVRPTDGSGAHGARGRAEACRKQKRLVGRKKP